MAKITDSLKVLAEKALGVIMPTPRYDREHPEERIAPAPAPTPVTIEDAEKPVSEPAGGKKKFKLPKIKLPQINIKGGGAGGNKVAALAKKVFISGGRNGLIIRAAVVLVLMLFTTCADRYVATGLTAGVKGDNAANVVPEEFKNVRGAATVSAIISLIETEFDRPFGGYRRDNVLWYGWLAPYDNVQSFQSGVFDVVQRVMFFLKERVSKEGGSSDPFNANLKDAAEWTNAPGFIPVATNLMYNHFAVSNLETYRDDLKAKKASFVGQSEALYFAFQMLYDMLGDAHNELSTDKVTATTADDYYYHALGVAYASQVLMRGLAIDFADEISRKNIDSHVERFNAEMAKAMDRKIPWMVWNNSQINDRSMLETPINEARNKLPSAMASIEK